MNPVLQDGVDLDIAGKVQIFVDLVHRYPLSSFAESAAGTAVPFMALNAKQSNRERSISDCTRIDRSEEHTSELQSLMRISYAVFCLKKTKEKLENNKYTNK